jgi:hypothetical protein
MRNDVPKSAQTAVVLPYTNLEGCQDLMYQITFFNAAAVWRERTTMAVLDV